MVNRPDESDFAVARDYALKTYRRFTGEDAGAVGDFERTQETEEVLDAIEEFRFHVVTQLPSRLGEDCCMCMLCEESCPTRAMDAERGEADRGRCITCLRCVAECPEEVLRVNDLSQIWPVQLVMEKETEETLAGKASRIYL